MDDYRDMPDDELDVEEELEEQAKPDLDSTLQALIASEEDTLSSVVFYGLSGLSDEDIRREQAVWDTLTPEHRSKVIRRLVDVSEANFDLDYTALGWFVLNDSVSEVREAAIELLWEDESLLLMDRLIEMAQWDDAIAVRAAAAGALGRFILMGELGELPVSETTRAQDTVVSLLSDESEVIEVRRRSLEAIANCGHEIVSEAIDEAYHDTDVRMRASAVFAMGRTCDPRWEDVVLREIDSIEPEMRYEAARASGELEITEAVPALARLARGGDPEIREVAIWSLGEIGGSSAVKTLTRLADEAEEAGEDDLLEIIEEAIGNASLVGADMAFDFDE